MNLGDTIKEIRKKKNISQKDLAIGCDITQTYLSLIENNKKEPNITLLRAIACFLNIPLPILFFLSLNNEDIPEEKQSSYKLLAPSINSLIETFFVHDTND